MDLNLFSKLLAKLLTELILLLNDLQLLTNVDLVLFCLDDASLLWTSYHCEVDLLVGLHIWIFDTLA